jgi:hypothetical protein
VGRAFSTHVRDDKMHTNCWSENLKIRDHLGDRRSLGDNIKLNSKEVGCEGADWIHLTQGR